MIRVLLIDDEPGILRALTNELRRAGFEIVGAANDPVEAREFYALAEVVVSDWVMPAGGGAVVLKESPVPVVVHSSIAGMTGAKYWVTKPGSGEDLTFEISRAMQGA
jgi:DNA-binding NtrC family response regulator